MSNYSKENYEYVKKLIGNGIFKEDFDKQCRLSGDELHTIFCAFRSQRYRVFLTELQGYPYYAPKETYMQMHSIGGSITCSSDLLRICLLADPHFGSIFDNPHIMDRIIDFCIQNDIYTIVILGDVLEGNDYHILYKDAHKLRYDPNDVEKQLEYLQSCIPLKKGFRIFIGEGNHDLFSNTGIANDILLKYINTMDRKDITIVGYDLSELHINDSILYLNHGAFDYSKLNLDYSANTILSGHSHMTDWLLYDTQQADLPTLIEKKVVSCSNIKHGNEDSNNFCGFAVLDIRFDENGNYKELVFQDYKIDDPLNIYSKPYAIGSRQTVRTHRLTKN